MTTNLHSYTFKQKVFIVLFLPLILMGMVAIFENAFLAGHNFLAAKGDWDKIRKATEEYVRALNFKKIIPPGVPVDVSPFEQHISRVTARYVLYPNEFSKNWIYFLDQDNSVVEASPHYKRVKFNSVTAYAKPGHDFIKPFLSNNHPIGKIFFCFLIVSIFTIYTGSIILGNFSLSSGEGRRWWHWANSYMAGFLFLTSILWVYLLSGGVLEQKTVILLWSVAAGVALLYSRLARSGHKECNFAEPSARGGSGVLKFLAILIIVSLFLATVLIPVRNWDAMSNWIIKSKVIFHEQTLDFHYTSYNYYPILWSLNIAAQFAVMGGDCDEVAQWTAGLFLLCFFAQLHRALFLLNIRQKYLWLVLFLYPIFIFYDDQPFMTATPENGLMAFFIATLVFILMYLRNSTDKESLALSVLMAFGMSLMKLEGAIIAVFIGLGTVWANRSQGVARAIFLNSGFFLSLLPSFLWGYWVKTHGYFQQLYHLNSGLSFSKIWLLAKALGIHLYVTKIWVVLVFAVLYFCFFSNPHKWTKEEKFLGIVGCFLILFSLAALSGWSTSHIFRSGVETAGRLFFHATPALTLLWASRAFANK